MSLKLINKFTDLGAMIYATQSEHRKTALQYLICGTDLMHEKNQKMFPDDPLWEELEGVMPVWAVETLAQGAYIREYHIWEKETKEYFVEQLVRNELSGEEARVCRRNGESHVSTIQRMLSNFSIFNLEDEINQIESMRLKVNEAKHDPGVLIEHFVSIDNFWEKHTAINAFWSKLAKSEIFEP